MIQNIDVGLVYPSSTSRPIDPKKVADIAASIKEIGLLNPICVRACVRHKGTTPFDAFNIVAGHHRYDAACFLKWETIPCSVVELDDLHAELAEIDENLMRTDLSPAQEASAVSRRKAIYEELYPETKHGGNRSGEQVAKSATRFTTETAGVTGKSERTVQTAAARGRALGDDLHAVQGTSLDKGVELDALAKMPASERASVIERAKSGERVSARPPKIAADPLTDELAAEKQVARLMDAWNAAGHEARQEFLNRIDQPVMDHRYGSAA